MCRMIGIYSDALHFHPSPKWVCVQNLISFLFFVTKAWVTKNRKDNTEDTMKIYK